MKYIILLLAISVSYFNNLKAQVIGEKLGSGGSILYEGFSIDADFGEKKISFDLAARIDLNDKNDKSHDLLLGFSASGANNDNFLDLFTKGEFSTSSKLGTNIGYSLDLGRSQGLIALEKKLETLDKDLAKVLYDIDNKFKSFINQTLGNFANINPNKKDLIEALKKNYNKHYQDTYEDGSKRDKSNYKTLVEYFEVEIRDKNSQTANVEGLVKHVKTSFSKFQVDTAKKFTEKKSLKRKKTSVQKSINRKKKDRNPFILTPYVTTSLLGDKFKHLVMSEDSTMGQTLKDTSHIGGYFGFGLNLEYDKALFGLRYTREYENNFEILTKSTFTLDKTELIDGVEHKEKIETIAYRGDFQLVHFDRLVIDAMFFTKLGENYKVAINPFLRCSFSGDKEISPDIVDLGIASYFFGKEKSKLLGGIYLFASDLRNNISEFMGEDKKSLLNRLNFGVSASYVFNDFASIFNKSSVRSAKE